MLALSAPAGVLEDGIGEYPVEGFDYRGGEGSRWHWAVTMTPSGRIVASGTGSGLVELEGGQWRPLTASGGFDWQTLLADDSGRIWAGGHDEIGVYEPDSNGSLHYRSLTGLLPAAERELGDVWNVYSERWGAVFVGKASVVVTDGSSATSWHIPSERRLFSWKDSGSLFIGAEKGAVFRMTGAGPVREIEEGSLGVLEVLWTEGIGGTDWIGLTDFGLISPRPEAADIYREVNKQITKSAPVAAMRIADGKLVVGTYFGGLFFIDEVTGSFKQLGEREGLGSTSVVGLNRDDRGSLWVTTTRSLDRVATSGTVVLFRNSAGLEGSEVHFVEGSESLLNVGTDAGTFRLASGIGEEVKRIHDRKLTGQTRVGATAVGGGLGGLYRISNGKVNRIAREADDVIAVLAASDRKDLVYYVAGPLMRAAKVRDGEVEIVATETFDTDIESMVEGPDGDVWVAAGPAVVRVSLVGDKPRFVRRDRLAIAGWQRTPAAKTTVFGVGGSVFAVRDGTLLGISASTGAFEALDSFKGVEVVDVASTSAGEAWALTRPAGHTEGSPRLTRLRHDTTGQGLAADVMDAPGLFSAGSLRSVHAVDLEPGVPELWIGASKGLLRVDLARMRIARPPPPLEIRMVRSVEGEARPATVDAARFPHDVGLLRFHWSAPGVIPGDVLIETRLRGSGEAWKPADARWSREFTGLGEGDYVFEARVIDGLGRTGPAASRAFAVLPPWYRTGGAILAFALTGVALSFAGWRWRLSEARRRAAQLEHLVKVRTLELEHVSAEKTRFIARMNHEIRNPLNGLLGAMSVLEQFPHTGKEGRFLQILRTCADHLGTVVEDVLDFANIESGKVVLHERAFSVAKVVESVPRMMHAEADRTGTTLSTRIGEDVPQVVLGDPDRIRQILVNFLGNALKFAPGEPVEVEILTTTTNGVPWLRFAVRDHGPGISEADKRVLFSMFERGKGASKRNVKGMGIGLATCRLLARRMGGEVGVISGLGEGSEFFLKLPLRVATPEASQGDVAPEPFYRLACLVVEDQEFNRVILRDILERFGCAVDEADDPETALELAAANSYDAIFADLELPDAAPGEILKLFEARRPAGGRAGPAIVVTTAYATENVRQTCFAAGATAFLAKPLTATKVVEVLRNIDASIRPAAQTSVNIAPPAAAPGVGGVLGGIDEIARIRGCCAGSVAAEIAAEIATEFASLDDGVRAGNFREVAHHAHRLLSLAAIADSPDLAGAALPIQNAAREGRMPDTGDLAALVTTVANVNGRLVSINRDGASGGQSRGPGRSGPARSPRTDSA